MDRTLLIYHLIAILSSGVAALFLYRMKEQRSVMRTLLLGIIVLFGLALAAIFFPVDGFARVQLLVLDDWLRDPLTRTQSQDLLEILDDRYGRSSTMVATQVPVAEWHVRFPDPTIGDAILDRLIHNAYRLNLKGESRRKVNSHLTMPTT